MSALRVYLLVVTRYRSYTVKRRHCLYFLKKFHFDIGRRLRRLLSALQPVLWMHYADRVNVIICYVTSHYVGSSRAHAVVRQKQLASRRQL